MWVKEKDILMRLSIEEAVTACMNKLLRNGVPREEAEIAAPIYLEGELWGKRTHGFRYLISCLTIYRCASEQRQTSTIERETAISAVINGGFHFPAFAHDMAMKLAITKAKQSGMAMVGVYKAGPSGLLGYYSQLATEADLIGVAINGTSPFVVPPHGVTPMLGTNPLTIGVHALDNSLSFWICLQAVSRTIRSSWRRIKTSLSQMELLWMKKGMGRPIHPERLMKQSIHVSCLSQDTKVLVCPL